jgi:hypothetical protein
MTNLTDEIRSLSAALHRLSDNLETKATDSKFDQELAASFTLKLLEDFKDALDQARHTVWPYVIAMQQGSPENVDFALQQYRMQRVREMLGAIRSDEENLRSDAKTRLFLAEMNRMTNIQHIA